MDIGKLEKIFCYPIKSTSGMSLQCSEVDARGLKGDRAFAIYNTIGKIASGKNTRRFFRLDGIIDIKVEIRGSSILVLAPDNEEFLVPSIELNNYLSTLLSTELEVKPESNIPHMDDGSIHLITTEDLNLLESQFGSVVSDIRFRPNLLVNSHFLSSEILKYKTLKIGELTFKPLHQTERCRMITMAQGHLKSEPKLLKAVSEFGDLNFGIYLQPTQTGRLDVESRVEIQ